MSWYAETPTLRTRQIAGDVAVGFWALLWLWLATSLHRAVSKLAAPGRELEEAGTDLAGGLGRAAERTDDVPLLGGGLSAPLDAAAEAGAALARAGEVQQDAVSTLAFLLAFVVAVLPITFVVLRWLPGRLEWRRSALAARVLRSDVDLLALRAAVHTPLHELAALGPEPVARWRRGEPDAAAALAAVELRRLGLRPEPLSRRRP